MGLTTVPQIIKTIVRIYRPPNFNTNFYFVCRFYFHTLKLVTTYSYDSVQENQDGLELKGLNHVLVLMSVVEGQISVKFSDEPLNKFGLAISIGRTAVCQSLTHFYYMSHM
jgi:hypothetical protein